MIVLLSPAKTFDVTTPVVPTVHTTPRLLDQSEQLIKVMSKQSVASIREMMRVSEKTAVLTIERYRNFQTPFTPDTARPAISTFNGDVYRGLDAPATFTTEDYDRAQQVLRILSGLYGLLRPLDLIQPYRLEMHIKVPTRRGKNLHQFWGDLITDLMAQDLAVSPGQCCVVNLASTEYSSAVDLARFRTVVSPRFEDISATGERKLISLYAKRARGLMAGWIIRNRIDDLDALKDFAIDGYSYDKNASTPEIPVFFRP